MAPVLVTSLNDLFGHTHGASLFNCNPSNIYVIFYYISIDSALASIWALIENLLSFVGCSIGQAVIMNILFFCPLSLCDTSALYSNVFTDPYAIWHMG